MSQRAFLLTAGVLFLMIALAHLIRLVFGVPFVVADISVPMWASGLAAVLMAYLAWQGFRLAGK